MKTNVIRIKLVNAYKNNCLYTKSVPVLNGNELDDKLLYEVVHNGEIIRCHLKMQKEVKITPILIADIGTFINLGTDTEIKATDCLEVIIDGCIHRIARGRHKFCIKCRKVRPK